MRSEPCASKLCNTLAGNNLWNLEIIRDDRGEILDGGNRGG